MCFLFWSSCLFQFYFCGHRIEYELYVFLAGHLDIFKEIGLQYSRGQNVNRLEHKAVMYFSSGLLSL